MSDEPKTEIERRILGWFGNPKWLSVSVDQPERDITVSFSSLAGGRFCLSEKDAIMCRSPGKLNGMLRSASEEVMRQMAAKIYDGIKPWLDEPKPEPYVWDPVMPWHSSDPPTKPLGSFSIVCAPGCEVRG